MHQSPSTRRAVYYPLWHNALGVGVMWAVGARQHWRRHGGAPDGYMHTCVFSGTAETLQEQDG